MKIKFIASHKSIESFKEKEIKDFSIFTGLNGSGKTHILGGIKLGKIQVDNIDISIDTSKVVCFNFSDFLLQNQPASDTISIAHLKINAWNFFNQWQLNFIQFDDQIKNCLKDNIKKFYNANNEDIKEDQKQNYQNMINQIITFIETPNSNDIKSMYLIKSIFMNTDKPLGELEESEFMKKSNFDHLDYQLLNNLSEIFLDHKKKIILGKMPKELGGFGLSNEETQDLEDTSPWKLINNIFKNYNLEHRVNAPVLNAGDFINKPSFSFQVTLTINNKLVHFADLSSGEKILVALAITIFQDKKSTFPKLLLLDEIDATLHPSMINKVLDVINNVFRKNGTKVIMATHSPTTIAHVPENSIYEIKKGNVQDKIVEIDKSKALDILTDGFATLNEGITFLDSLAKKELTIFTEGKNSKYINKAIELLSPELIEKVEVVTGIEKNSGESQLKFLFDCYLNMQHQKKVLFVWDCDSKDKKNFKDIKEENNTIPYFFDKNEKNVLVKKGIENLFDSDLFKGTLTRIEDPDCTIHEKLNQVGKDKFLQLILNRSEEKDFANFQPLIDKITEHLKAK